MQKGVLTNTRGIAFAAKSMPAAWLLKIVLTDKACLIQWKDSCSSVPQKGMMVMLRMVQLFGGDYGWLGMGCVSWTLSRSLK